MSERRPTFGHRVEYALFSAVVSASKVFGDRISSEFGGAMGRLGYFPIRFRRRLVESNLRIAFPEKDDAWIIDTMRRAYAHLGRETITTIRLGQLSREQILARTKLIGEVELRAALAEGKGVVITSGHIGNHEVGTAAVSARGIPVDIVVQRLGNPLFDAALNESRRRHGTGVIDRSEAHRGAVKSLRSGRVAGFAADQNAGKAGIFVPFFGRLASTHRGPALFAIKTGAPLFLGTNLRIGRTYESTVQRVDVDRSGDLDEAVYRLTAAFTARLEEVVRSAPDQYLWLHRRWRSRPESERIPGKQV